jgi:predicted nucleic acid-binding protein
MVSTHPFVIGELACGQLQNRDELLGLLQQLPVAATATDEEALHFIEAHRLMARGIGYVDVHLLASVALTRGARLWTRDRRLGKIAREMGLAHA